MLPNFCEKIGKLVRFKNLDDYLFSFQQLAQSKAHQVRCAFGNIFDKYGKPLSEVNIVYAKMRSFATLKMFIDLTPRGILGNSAAAKRRR